MRQNRPSQNHCCTSRGRQRETECEEVVRASALRAILSDFAVQIISLSMSNQGGRHACLQRCAGPPAPASSSPSPSSSSPWSTSSSSTPDADSTTTLAPFPSCVCFESSLPPPSVSRRRSSAYDFVQIPSQCLGCSGQTPPPTPSAVPYPVHHYCSSSSAPVSSSLSPSPSPHRTRLQSTPNSLP